MVTEDSLEDNIRRLHDIDANVRREARYALVKIGMPAFLPVLDTFVDSEPHVRRSAALTLGLLGDRRATLPLIEALQDKDPTVRCAVVAALGKLGDERAIPPIMNLLTSSHIPEWQEATRALAVLGPTAIPSLINALTDQINIVRLGAALSLGNHQDARVVKALITATTDSESIVRNAAIQSLHTLNAKSATNAVRHALQDTDPCVRYWAATALGKLGGPENLQELRLFAISNSEELCSDKKLKDAALEAITNIETRVANSEH